MVSAEKTNVDTFIAMRSAALNSFYYFILLKKIYITGCNENVSSFIQ
jgi:hypothetical protein